MFDVDGRDMRILRALPVSGSNIISVFQGLVQLGIDERELGDRLEALAQKGFIQAAGLGGRYAPRMTLSNGIHNVRLTDEGRQLLKGQQ